MARKSRKRKHQTALHRDTPPGAAPGSLVRRDDTRPARIHAFAYGPDKFIEERNVTLEKLRELRSASPLLWVDVDDFGDVDILLQLGELFGLHPLALEDVVNAHQRPKVEQYGNHLFIVARMAMLAEQEANSNNGIGQKPLIGTEQLSLFLGAQFVITVQEQIPGDSLEPVRQRLRNNVGIIRREGTDYLAYSLLDAVVDGCFPILERYGEHLEELEEEILHRPGADAVPKLHQIKHDLLIMRRTLWPLRDAIHVLIRDPNPLIEDDTRVYLRDCYDHTVRITELIEVYRELGSDLMGLHLNCVNNRTNEVMKVLSIIATIFMPMNFVAAVYGMNFNSEYSPFNMPELNWYFGYPMALLVMVTMASSLLLFFRRRGWI